MIESVAGPVHDVEMVSAGYNSEIAARVHLDNGTLFVKGLRQDHPRVWTQQRETDINPFASGLTPELRWQIRKGGWDLLGFEDLGGRHADYSPGSPDVELVLQSMWCLASAPLPTTVGLKSMSQRMSAHVTDPADVQFFEGGALCCTPTGRPTTSSSSRTDAPGSSTGLGPPAEPRGLIPPYGPSGSSPPVTVPRAPTAWPGSTLPGTSRR